MKFVLIGKMEKPREEVAREITEMGGKVVTKVDKKTAACISSKGALINNVVYCYENVLYANAGSSFPWLVPSSGVASTAIQFLPPLLLLCLLRHPI